MQLLRSSGSFTDEERQALNSFKWKLFWMVATFTIWYDKFEKLRLTLSLNNLHTHTSRNVINV